MIFFLLMGLAGSVPLALTLVQRDFYLSPSLPYFALTFSLFLSLYLVDILRQFAENTKAFRVVRMLGFSLLAGGLVYTGMMPGKTGRDQDILHDTCLFGEIIEEGSRVHLEAEFSPEDSLRHWNLELYLARYFNISLGAAIEDCKYIIFFEDGTPPDENIFESVPLDTETYLLFQRKIITSEAIPLTSSPVSTIRIASSAAAVSGGRHQSGICPEFSQAAPWGRCRI